VFPAPNTATDFGTFVSIPFFTLFRKEKASSTPSEGFTFAGNFVFSVKPIEI